MATTLKQIIAPANLTASVATYYTVPTNVVTVIRALTIANSSTNARTVDIHIVSSGDSADTSNIVINDIAVASEETKSISDLVNHVLDEGDTVQVSQDAGTDLVIVASGAEVS